MKRFFHFLFHDYSKWEIKQAVYVAGPLGRLMGLPSEFTKMVQIRKCNICDKVKVEVI